MVDAVGSPGGSGGKAAKAQHICKVCDKTFSRIQSLKVKWYLYVSHNLQRILKMKVFCLF